MRHISKSFPGVKALDDVGFSVAEGEVRALVGENGAGKSTLMKILNGNYKKDEGQILIDGKEVDITDPLVAAANGISIIFQELNLVDQLSIAENIFAGRLSSGLRRVNWKEINRKAKELLDRIGFDADPRTEVGSLTVAGKQMVEIAKALSRDCRIIGTVNVGEVSPDRIVEMMVGREVSSAYPKRSTVPGEEILRVENLCRKDRKQNVSFSLHRGEVLGIAGLVGAGRTEIMRGLFGVDYITSCDVYVRGQKVRITTPAAAKKQGIAFLTEDRKVEGLTLDFTIKANMSMANLPKLRRGLLTSAKAENEIADQYIKLINVKTPSRNQKVGNLSGGNQQKVVIGKWLNADPEILIMDEPTRGIDVGAKWEIYGIINELAAQGKAVILISSELPEVLGMSDRVLVVKDDAIVAELTGDEINAVEVMRYAL